MYNQDILIGIILELKNSFPSLNEFAKVADVNAGYLSKIINKKTLNPPTPSILEKLSNTSILHKDDYYSKMMSACGYLNNTLTNEDIKNAKNKSNSMSFNEKKEIMLNYMNKNKIENLFAIPLYKKIENNIESSEDYIEGYIPLNPNMYNMKNPNDYFYIKMPDDSMDQKYKKGDYILMKKDTSIRNDTIALLLLENKTIIRKITTQDTLILLEKLSINTKDKIQAYPQNAIKILAIAIGHIGYE